MRMQVAEKKRNTRQTLRADKNKEAAQDTYREKLSFAGTLNEICKIEGKLYDHGTASPDDEDVILHDPAALKMVLDSKWRRMNKLLPDLKAVEGQMTHNINTYNIIETHNAPD